MPVGGILTIETRNEFVDECHVLLKSGANQGWYSQLIVSDTGKGMDRETLDRIFEPFYTTKGKGTGLGLSTVYGIMQQSGGIITVESEPGHGALFRLYFPADSSLLTDKKSANINHDVPKPNETILLAEDEDSVRELATLALERVGYKVITAENGIAAVKLFDKHHGTIDLLLTDVIMPKMGGKELVDACLVQKPNTKVLYMSGYTDDSIVQHGVLDKGTHFIQKPFTPDRLIRKIRQIISAPNE